MNLFVADPEWGWWIILYFFLGGLAAGAYFVSALIELIGSEADRVVARAGYREGVVVADIDLGHAERIRKTLPALAHRRSDLFTF